MFRGWRSMIISSVIGPGSRQALTCPVPTPLGELCMFASFPWEAWNVVTHPCPMRAVPAVTPAASSGVSYSFSATSIHPPNETEARFLKWTIYINDYYFQSGIILEP